MLGELIDLQRNLEVFAAAGAQEVALPPNGRMQFPKLTGGSTAYWVGEGEPITESQPATGNLDLQAKKLGVLVKVNNELLRFASPSAEGLVRLDMARVAALKADLAMLEGTGGTQIKGLLTYCGITHAHGQHDRARTATRSSRQDVALMDGKLPDAVDAPTAWVMRKAMFAALMNRRADAVSAGRRQGAVPVPPDRATRPTPRRPSCTARRSCARRRCRTRASKGGGHEPDVHPARLLPGLEGPRSAENWHFARKWAEIAFAQFPQFPDFGP